MGRRFVAFLGAVLCLIARDARADDPAPAANEHKSQVYWHDEWSRFTVGEALISAAVTFRNNDIGGALNGPDSASIKFEVPLLDHGLRDVFKGSTQARRDGAARLSDLGFHGLV